MNKDYKKLLFSSLTPDDILNLNDPNVFYLLIEIAENLVLTDATISNAVYRSARYPIIGFSISPTELNEKINEIVNQTRLKEFLISLLVDYYTYGIAIANIQLVGKKILICSNNDCHREYPLEAINNILKYELKDGLIKTSFKCITCNSDTYLVDKSHFDYIIRIKNDPNIKPEYYSLPNGINITRWNIKDVEIRYNKFSTNELIKIPKETIEKYISELLEFPASFLIKVDYELLKSYFTKKELYLKPNTYKIIKFVLPSGVNLPSIPMIARGYRLVLVLLELYKAIINASQEIIPYRLLYIPQSSQLGATPIYNIQNKEIILNNIIKEIEKNPQRIGMLDFPLQQLEFGGNMSFVNLVQLLEFLYIQLINATEMPKQLVLEGTWAGNIIAIRLLENSLIGIMQDLNEFLDMFAKTIYENFNIKEFNIKLLPFRRMDSIEEIQTMAQLFGLENIPKEQLYQLFFGQSMKEILEQLENERKIVDEYSAFSELEKNLRAISLQSILNEILQPQAQQQAVSEEEQIEKEQIGEEQIEEEQVKEKRKSKKEKTKKEKEEKTEEPQKEEEQNIEQQQQQQLENEDIQKIAEKIIEESGANLSIIKHYIKAIAENMGENVALRVLEEIKKLLKDIEIKKSKNAKMPEKYPTRRDDVK